jgi:hypothetical protein
MYPPRECSTSHSTVTWRPTAQTPFNASPGDRSLARQNQKCMFRSHAIVAFYVTQCDDYGNNNVLSCVPGATSGLSITAPPFALPVTTFSYLRDRVTNSISSLVMLYQVEQKQGSRFGKGGHSAIRERLFTNSIDQREHLTVFLAEYVHRETGWGLRVSAPLFKAIVATDTHQSELNPLSYVCAAS